MRKYWMLALAFGAGALTGTPVKDMLFGFNRTPKQKQDLKTFREECSKAEKIVLNGGDCEIQIEAGDSTFSMGSNAA